MAPTKTGFDKFFAEQMKSTSFAKSYGEARAEVDAIDRLVRALDTAREQVGLSKADLAEAIEARPEVVRRLFTTKTPNPTLATLVRLAAALGFRVELVPQAGVTRLAKRSRAEVRSKAERSEVDARGTRRQTAARPRSRAPKARSETASASR